jgi:NTP pyrophosphatase (non-canonical NTP hydrolase)
MTLPDPNVKIVTARDAERKNLRRLVDPHDPYVDRSVFHRTIARFGVEHQVSLIMEECSELILAISHYRRGRVKSDAIMEEIVDMTIMLEQARLIFDPTDEKFGEIYKKKIERLEKLLRK